MEITCYVEVLGLVNKSIVLECLPHDELTLLLAKYSGFLPNGCIRVP